LPDVDLNETVDKVDNPADGDAGLRVYLRLFADVGQAALRHFGD
jgi:hypothetical protein